jgi:Stm1
MEMQRSNPFDVLRDDNLEDPSQLIAAKQPQKIASTKVSQSKLPSRPLPPQQAGWYRRVLS